MESRSRLIPAPIPAAISGSHQSDRLVGHPQLASILYGLGGDDAGLLYLVMPIQVRNG